MPNDPNEQKPWQFDLSEIGQTGLVEFSGRVHEEFLHQLRNERAIRVFKEMKENDSVIGSILFAIDMLIRGVHWYVEPFDNEPENIAKAEFVESCMHDMSYSWMDTISEILSMLPFGWSYHEIVYKRRAGDSDDPTQRSKFNDNLIGWRKLPIRSQDSLYEWVFDDKGGIRGIIQEAQPSYTPTYIPIEKSLLFRTTSQKNNPEGRSVLRNAYRSWFFKKRIEEIEGIGIERDLAGLPIAFVPPELLSVNCNPEDKAMLEQLKKIVRNVRRDTQEGIIFPLIYDPDTNQKMYDFQLLSTGGQRQFDTSKIIERYSRQMAMTVLADFIMMGHEAVGSFSLADSKTTLFSVAIKSFLKEILDTFNRYAIPRLFKVNGLPTDQLPKLCTNDLETPDLVQLGEYISKLAGVGMSFFPDDDLENYLRRAANLPEKMEKY